jgi:cobalamin synthase
MRRLLFYTPVVSPLFILFSILSAGYVLAQAIGGTPTVAPVDYAQKAIDVGLTLLMTFLGPVITRFMTTSPPWVRYLVTAVCGAGTGFATGEYSSYPMQGDTGAILGILNSLGVTKFLHEQLPPPAPAPAQP